MSLGFVYIAGDSLRNISLEYTGNLYSRINSFNEHMHNIYSSFNKSMLVVEQNQILRSELARLHAKVSDHDLLASENKSLNELLGASGELGGSFATARIIAWGGSKEHIVLINKGRRDMVFLGQAVLDAKGVIGQVTQVKDKISKVTLITSEKVSVPIKNKFNLKGFAHGYESNLKIENIVAAAKVKLGDQLYSSGIAHIYPAGYPYAKVIDLYENSSGNKTAIMQASADLEHMDYVLMYWADSGVKPPYRRL